MGKVESKKNSSLKKETIQRIISALIVAPFVVFCFVSYQSLVGLVAAIVLISSSEFFFTTIKRINSWLAITYSAIVTTYPILYGVAFRKYPMELLSVIFMVGIIVALSKVRDREIITEVYFAYSVALVYISFLLSFFYPAVRCIWSCYSTAYANAFLDIR